MSEDVANVDQDEYWNTAAATHWVQFQDHYDALLAPLDSHLLRGAEISDGDHVLDLGCGCGATTRAAARRALGGRALGIDLSEPMLERARAVADEEGLTNVEFVRGDAQVYEFGDRSFDVAISRFGVMFFADPVAAFANVARAVRAGGRLAVLCWQELARNEWILVPAAAAATVVPPPEPAAPDEPGPFSLGDADRVRGILSSAGWSDVNLDEVREPLRLGADTGETIAFLRGTGSFRRLLEDADDATVERAVGEIRAALAAYESPDGVVLGSSAWLVSGRR